MKTILRLALPAHLDRAEELAQAAQAPVTVWRGPVYGKMHYTLAHSDINWESRLGWQPVAYVPVP